MDTVEILESPRSSRSLWWMLTVSCLAVALVVASMAALYTALPGIAVDIGASQTQLTWIVDGYTLVLACLVLPAGALGDRYGRRRALIVGLLVFSVASALPLLVADPIVLIAARASAGLGAALIMPSTLSILTGSFPSSGTGRAVGIWAGVAGAAGAVGIVGSGLLLRWWSWHSIFATLAGVGAVLLVLAFALPESREVDRPPLDPIGSVCVAVGLGLAVVGTIEAPLRGWLDVGVLGLFAGAAVALAAFVLVELRAEHPLLDIRLLALRGFGSGAASITIEFFAIFGIFLLLVQYLQLVLGYSALLAASAMGPMVVPIAAISAVAPWLADRIGSRVVLSVAMVILAGGLFAASRLDSGATYLDVLWPLLIISVGIGLGMAPPTALIMADTPKAKQGSRPRSMTPPVNWVPRSVSRWQAVCSPPVTAPASSPRSPTYPSRLAAPSPNPSPPHWNWPIVRVPPRNRSVRSPRPPSYTAFRRQRSHWAVWSWSLQCRSPAGGRAASAGELERPIPYRHGPQGRSENRSW